MRVAIRLSLVCAIELLGSARARGQEVAIVQCWFMGIENVGMSVSNLSLSTESALPFDARDPWHLECATVMATLLSAGYELVVTETDYVGWPAYTLVQGGAKAGPRPPRNDTAFVGCKMGESGLSHMVYFAASSPGSPTVSTGPTSSCAGELSKLMRLGFELVQGVRGNLLQEGMIYLLHRGAENPLVVSKGFAATSDVMVATLQCRRSYNGVTLLVTEAETSFGGAPIGAGDGVDCAAELSSLLERGFRILDVGVASDANFLHLTMLTGGTTAARSKVPMRRPRPEPQEFAIVQCMSPLSLQKSWVMFASMSPGLPSVTEGADCERQISAMLSAGFVLLDVSGDRYGDAVLYTLGRRRCGIAAAYHRGKQGS